MMHGHQSVDWTRHANDVIAGVIRKPPKKFPIGVSHLSSDGGGEIFSFTMRLISSIFASAAS